MRVVKFVTEEGVQIPRLSFPTTAHKSKSPALTGEGNAKTYSPLCTILSCLFSNYISVPSSIEHELLLVSNDVYD